MHFQYSKEDEESRFEYKFNIIFQGQGDPQSSATPLVHFGSGPSGLTGVYFVTN